MRVLIVSHSGKTSGGAEQSLMALVRCVARERADVRLTMVDGEVLYRDGEFKTIDIEKVKAETQKRTDAILRRL